VAVLVVVVLRGAAQEEVAVLLEEEGVVELKVEQRQSLYGSVP
jgi:hypothetical protein